MISFHCGTFQPKKFTIFVDFVNTCHPTNIKFTCEISSKRTVFLDTEVLKGPCCSTLKYLTQAY